MREDTIGRKKASGLFQELRGRGWLLERMAEVISEGKRGLDGLALELGRMVAEAVMYLEREEVAGPDYRPYSSEVRKWASQPGSSLIAPGPRTGRRSRYRSRPALKTSGLRKFAREFYRSGKRTVLVIGRQARGNSYEKRKGGEEKTPPRLFLLPALGWY